jgi:FHS family Na+ dependent glucose MFS transporter 1
VAWLLWLPSPQTPVISNAGEGARDINYWVVTLVAMLLCLYIGAEVSYASWIYSYVLKMNLGSKDMATYLTSAFWASLTIGRLLGVPLAARFRPGTLLLTDLAGCFISLAVALLWSRSPFAITAASIGAGLSMASIYPMALTFAERRTRITGQVTGFLLLGGSAGGMIVPFLIGQMFEKNGPRIMMITILFDLVAALAVYLVLVFGSSPEYRPVQQEA